MATNYIYKTCVKCGGSGSGQPVAIVDEFGLTTGEYETSDDCENCKGFGKVLWGTLEDEIFGEE
jgi:hypothetical protein